MFENNIIGEQGWKSADARDTRYVRRLWVSGFGNGANGTNDKVVIDRDVGVITIGNNSHAHAAYVTPANLSRRLLVTNKAPLVGYFTAPILVESAVDSIVPVELCVYDTLPFMPDQRRSDLRYQWTSDGVNPLFLGTDEVTGRAAGEPGLWIPISGRRRWSVYAKNGTAGSITVSLTTRRYPGQNFTQSIDVTLATTLVLATLTSGLVTSDNTSANPCDGDLLFVTTTGLFANVNSRLILTVEDD